MNRLRLANKHMDAIIKYNSYTHNNYYILCLVGEFTVIANAQ